MTDYERGWIDYEDGKPYDKREPPAWRDGWNDHEDATAVWNATNANKRKIEVQS